MKVEPIPMLLGLTGCILTTGPAPGANGVNGVIPISCRPMRYNGHGGSALPTCTRR